MKRDYEDIKDDEWGLLPLERLIELKRQLEDRHKHLSEHYASIVREIGNYSYYYHVIRDSIANLSDEPENKKPDPTYIYVMVDEHTGLHKIGRSKKPSARERTLQAQIPMLKILMQFEGDSDDEKSLHEKFSKKRVRGEWFQLDESDVEFIKSLKWREGDANE